MLGDETLTADGIEALHAVTDAFDRWFRKRSRFAFKHATTAVDQRLWPVSNSRLANYVDCMDENARRVAADDATRDAKIPLFCIPEAVRCGWRYLPSPSVWRQRTKASRKERCTLAELLDAEPLLRSPVRQKPRATACQLVNVHRGSRSTPVFHKRCSNGTLTLWERDAFDVARMPIYDVYARDDMSTPVRRNVPSSGVDWRNADLLPVLVGTRSIANA
jgi:hypothetical protein